MATAFYNVADPNNAFAVHSTTIIQAGTLTFG